DFKTLAEGAERLLQRRDVKTARLFDRKLDAELKRMEAKLKAFKPLMKEDRIQLAQMIDLASGNDPRQKVQFEAKVGEGVQQALKKQFNKYNLTGMTWAALTKSRSEGTK